MESLAISMVNDDSWAERLSKASQAGIICLVVSAHSSIVFSPATKRAIIFVRQISADATQFLAVLMQLA